MGPERSGANSVSRYDCAISAMRLLSPAGTSTRFVTVRATRELATGERPLIVRALHKTFVPFFRSSSRNLCCNQLRVRTELRVASLVLLLGRRPRAARAELNLEEE